MNNYKISKNQKSAHGFTIIELLAATLIFSVVLVVILASFLQIARMFYKGISINNTTESTRSLVDSIVSDVRLSQSFVNTQASGTRSYFCVGQHRYTYVLPTTSTTNRKVTAADLNPRSDTINGGIMVDTVNNSCPSPATNGTNPEQLLGPDMQLNVMDFNCTINEVCVIHAHIVFYGQDGSLFDSNISAWKNTSVQKDRASGAPDALCSGSLLNTQFCAASDISSSVTLGF
jgi:prepilin-type N-terminal cleavage/methylation domain-containing protein